MREVKYLSPTSIQKWFDDPSEFYLNYITENRPPRMPQTQPMAVGSAFDAYCKSFLYSRLTGCTGGGCGDYEFDYLFTAQVEEHNRDFAYAAGGEVFDYYRSCGALADLILEMDRLAHGVPVFETTVKGWIDGIPLLGKPDIWFEIKVGDGPEGALTEHAIYDWKCNGFCSKSKTSPKKYYVRSYNGKGADGPHKGFEPRPHVSGLVLDEHGLEDVDTGWAAQTCIYQWLVGAPVGGEFLVGIEQLLGSPAGHGGRAACFRTTVGVKFQTDLLARAHRVWDSCRVGLSDVLDDSTRATLDNMGAGLAATGGGRGWDDYRTKNYNIGD